MRYVISYDIVDERRRRRIAEALKDYGVRVQESVFVAELTELLFQKMWLRVTKEMGDLTKSEDKINVWEVCEACWPKGRTLGKAQMPEDQDFYLV
jgi:CRISPR-associated protein Cas2